MKALALVLLFLASVAQADTLAPAVPNSSQVIAGFTGPCTSGTALYGDGTCKTTGGGSGTVSSVNVQLNGGTSDSIYGITGSPCTGPNCAFNLTLATQNANTAFLGPVSGTAATPAFRALVAADNPNEIIVPCTGGFATDNRRFAA